MKKLLIFLMLFAFGFGAYCTEVELASEHVSVTISEGTQYFVVYTVPADGEYRIEFNYNSYVNAYGMNSSGCNNYGTYNNNVYVVVGSGPSVTGNACPLTASYTKTFSAGDVIAVAETYVSCWYTTDYVLKVYGVAPAGEAPVITSELSGLIMAGNDFSYTITATGTAPIAFGSSGLPAFLSFDGVNTITGTVPLSQSSDFSFGISATNEFGSDSKTVSITVTPGEPPVITSSLTVSATAGEAFSYTTTATGSPTITFGSSGLPAELVGNGSSITGTLPINIIESSFSFTVTATNDFGSDSKTVNVTVAPGAGNGQFDMDNDVPAINAMSAAVTGAINAMSAAVTGTINTNTSIIVANLADLHNAIIEVGSYTLSIKDLLTTFLPDIEGALAEIETSTYQISEYTGMIADDTMIIKTDLGVVKTDIGLIKTNVIEINDKMTNIVDVITLLDTNQSQKLESIKGVLNQQLIVQQDQLTTQESILVLLDQIANPAPVVAPPMPIDEDTPDPIVPDFNFILESDKVPAERELKKLDKSFPEITNALRQRTGTLDFIMVIPLSKVSERLDDREINFSSGFIGGLVSMFRAIICCVLFYFTLIHWFKALKRIAD